jgi:drug/metabolite transporter (DMT)-like permease
MLGLALGLGAAVAWGFADFAGGVFSRGRPAASVVLGAQSAAVAALAALLAIGWISTPGSFLISAALAGVSSGFAAILLYRALAIGPMGVVAPIFALSASIPVVVGFAAGERASALQALGMLAAVGGCAAAARAPRDGEPIRVQGILTAIAASVFIGMGLVGLHAAAQTDAIWSLEESRLAELLTVAAIVLVTQRGQSSLRIGRPGAAIAVVGLVDLTASYFFAEASARGALAVVSVLASVYPVITIILAGVLLHEAMPLPQRIGALVAFAGVALLISG